MHEMDTKSSPKNDIRPFFGIIGLGNLGKALMLRLIAKGLNGIAVVKNLEQANQLQNRLNYKVNFVHSVNEIDVFPSYLFITVQENNFDSVIESLLSHSDRLNQTTVIHCSGVLGNNTLGKILPYSNGTASLHPYQTFRNSDKKVDFSKEELDFQRIIEIFDGVAWMCECSASIKDDLSKLVIGIDGKIKFVDEIDNFDRGLYHLSAVFSSNYTLASLKSAYELALKSGISPNDFIPKILSNTVENFIEFMENDSLKIPFPITGPIARADIKAIESHLLSLKNHDTEYKVYLLNSLAAIENLFSSKLINEEQYNKTKSIFVNLIKDIY